MSIHSMTGFGRATAMVEGVAHTVEIRGVNHRYLDIKVRLPRALLPLEATVRRAIRERLHRGRMDVLVSSGAGEGDVATDVMVNLPLARRVHAALAQIAAEIGVSAAEQLTTVAGWPGVLQPTSGVVDDDTAAAALLPAVALALDALQAMRRKEGAALARDVRGHLDAVDAARRALAELAPTLAAAHRARLLGRLTSLLADLDVEADEARVVQEVGLLAERSDVAEELARLESHTAQARALLVGEGAVGRRLDFLCQEMFREANTVGSKVQDAAMSGQVVALKARLEQLREQVQNVE